MIEISLLSVTYFLNVSSENLAVYQKICVKRNSLSLFHVSVVKTFQRAVIAQMPIFNS